jgi:hypothetical protein
MWHWQRPTERAIPRDRAVTHRLSGLQRRRKAAGIAAFNSQLKPGPHGEDPILGADMLGHFDRDVEVLFRQPPEGGAPISRFVQLYDRDDDPWQVSERWYERRKRAAVLASLPCERYRLAIEPACGIGVFTGALAARCDQVIAFDAAPNAVRLARARTRDLANVSVQTGLLPDDLPPGPADLLVFSEILYYLSDGQLRDTVDRALAALSPDGRRRRATERTSIGCWSGTPGCARWSYTGTSGSSCTCWSADDLGGRCGHPGSGRSRADRGLYRPPAGRLGRAARPDRSCGLRGGGPLRGRHRPDHP